mgnify:CR=1 FL=1
MPKSVLIVDDEHIVVEIAKRKLIEMGYDVLTAYDGELALSVLKQRIPDLILLDIQMPNMNGYSFLLEREKDPLLANVPIIAITAYGEMESMFKRHGVLAYLLKPLKLQELLDMVVKVLGPAA